MMNSRRQFVKNMGIGSAGLILSDISMASGIKNFMGANDTINVAVVGVNGHGITHINAYKKMEKVRIAVICDADSAVLDKIVSNLSNEGIKVKAYKDIRKLYEDKDIDAVSIVTPNHWHALATVWACQAGKHVCVEKPVSHSIWEGRKMVEAARKYKRLVQADLDSRSNMNLDAGIKYMQQNLGKVLLVRIMNYKRRTSIGKIMGPGNIPSTVDYDLWTGPSPAQPLPRKKLHYDWHWQWLTGNSELGNNGPHQLDICRWALGKSTLPRSAFSFGGRYGYNDDGETPNTQVAVFDYDGTPVIYDSRGLGEKTGIDNMDGAVIYSAAGKRIFHPYKGTANCVVYFICEKGILSGNTVYDNDGNVIKTFREQGSTGPQFSFIKALRSNKIEDLKTDILEGHLSAAISHMGNISYQLGQKEPVGKIKELVKSNPYLEQVCNEMEKHLLANDIDLNKESLFIGPTLFMDSKSERFTGVNSEKANMFVKDTYRYPYIIPDKI
ncbi:MAG: Gfo/Idh/MocA family oxidoreductase [Bacteroidales bacterium]|jgi:predicted dehydrogenase|nr:Gfo/Idh/MocA family oxidoreductase [Bacteroidales bacterium]